MALAGKGADIYMASGTATAATAAACTVITAGQGAPGANQWYRPTNQARRMADPLVAPNVYYNGMLQATSLYTWEPNGGMIKFLASPGALAVTLDYSWLAIAQCGGGKEWSLALEQDIADVSVFGNTWKSKLPVGQLTGDISIARWWLDDAFIDLMTATTNPGPRLLFSLYTDFTNNLRYEVQGWLKSDSVKAATAGVLEEELQFESEGTITYATWT